VYTLTAAVLRVTLKGTLSIVAVSVVLCVIYYLLLKILCQDQGAGVVEGLGCGLGDKGIVVRFSLEDISVFQAF
jgi:hypothetical protein